VENKKNPPNIQAKLAERKKKFENNFDVVTQKIKWYSRTQSCHL